MTIWQLDPQTHKFALIGPGPDFFLWDWDAGAYETTNIPLDPAKHLRAFDASVPLGLRSQPIPDEARSEELDSICVLVYRFANPGWSIVQQLPVETLWADEPITINNSGTVTISGR